MKKAYRVLHLVSNISIIFLTIIIGFVVVKEYVFDSPSTSNIERVTGSDISATSASKPANRLNPIGKEVPLYGIDWSANETTVVLYISTTCRYCDESKDFYQRLSTDKSVRIIAVLPQSTDEASKYLETHNIKVDQVLNSSLREIGVTATPTLLLVNGVGNVTDSWRGKLSPDKEAEVLAKLLPKS